MSNRCTCDPMSMDDMCPVHASGGHLSRIAALEAENERLRTTLKTIDFAGCNASCRERRRHDRDAPLCIVCLATEALRDDD